MLRIRIEAQLQVLTDAERIWKELQQICSCGPIPEIVWNSKVANWAGKAYRRSHRVEFNLSYFCTHPNWKDLEETVAHELCHVAQYRIYPQAKQAHGPEFRNLMAILGYSGDTYHYMDTQAAKKAAKGVREDITLFDL